MRIALAFAVVVAAGCGEVARSVPTPTRTVTPSRTAEPTTAPPTPTPRPSAPATASATATAPGTSRPPSPTPPAPSPSPATPTPSAAPPTPSPTPVRTPSGLPSLPPQPTLAPGATVVLTGERVFTLAPGASRIFDPVELAREGGRTPPACASLVWTSAWHATVSLRSAWIYEGTRNDIGAGRWGSSSLGGCSTFELRNEGSTTSEARLVFTIGSR